ncbi:NAD kinase [Brevibacterium litoralis]|uniref:NAD kinase n=1 Tax=Brevibacterium litoralis TaxID=3138935 RepID=UPI0032EEEFE1
MTRSIAVVLHPQRADARDAALAACATLQADGVRPVMLASEYTSLVEHAGPPEPRIHVVADHRIHAVAADLEMVMVLGGDGTILRAARRFHALGVPIMGVNLGHVGFLAESEKEDLDDAVHRAVARDYTVEKRLALDITVHSGGRVIHRSWALNDATIEKGEHSRMIELVCGVDQRPVSSFGCDGVILATPTGSTAYAFSAGGPIVWPEVEALLMVPISAHALFSEPLVVGPESRLGVEFLDTPAGQDAVLWCDGRREIDLPPGCRIEARRSSRPMAFARLHRGPFTDRLVAKFQLPVSGWRGPQQNSNGLSDTPSN